jgi:hypothetical protein
MNNKFVGMVLDEKVIAVWHFEFNGGNFLSTLRKKPTGGMELTSRFRYYRDDKPGPDSQDEKHWYGRDVKSTETLHDVRNQTAELARMEGSTLNEILMDESGVDGLLAKMEKVMPLSFPPISAYPLPVQQVAHALANAKE